MFNYIELTLLYVFDDDLVTCHIVANDIANDVVDAYGRSEG